MSREPEGLLASDFPDIGTGSTAEVGDIEQEEDFLLVLPRYKDQVHFVAAQPGEKPTVPHNRSPVPAQQQPQKQQQRQDPSGDLPFADAVPAERTLAEEQSSRNWWSRHKNHLLLLCAIVIVGLVVGLIVALASPRGDTKGPTALNRGNATAPPKSRNEPPGTEEPETGPTTESPTTTQSSATDEPTMKATTEPPTTAYSCEGAVSLPVNSLTLGSIANGTEGNTSICGKDVIGPVAWYSIEGTGRKMLVSTCTDETDFATDLGLFGRTCNNLNCHGFTDNFSGECKEITFNSRIENYYLSVLKEQDTTRTIGGTFGLLVIDGNNGCSDAIGPLPVGDSIAVGSMLNATEYGALCGDAYVSPAVWYWFVGTGTRIHLSACSDVTDFSPIIALYNGTCDDDLECIMPISFFERYCMSSTFESLLNRTYYFSVSKQSGDADGNNTFELRLERWS